MLLRGVLSIVINCQINFYVFTIVWNDIIML